MNQQKDIIRDARVLGTPKMLLLGLQHMFAMFGATILVPILVNSYFQSTSQVLSVQVTLFCAGFGTLFFHLCTKFKVPAFLGSSFAFLGGFSSVAALDTGIFANMADKEKLQYACGGIVVAGLLYLILALIIRCVGVKRVMRFLPPVVTGPIIICIGLSLAPSAVSNASTNWLIAIVALAVIIIFNIWGKGMFKIIPILLGVVISYVFAMILQGLGFTNPDGSVILNFAGVSSAAAVGLPPFILPKFNLTAILIMAPIAIATMMEHIGDISAISATVGENFIEDPGLHRTLIGDGIATSLSAMIGGPANTTYGENTGVLELSRVHDPKVVRLAAGYVKFYSKSSGDYRIDAGIDYWRCQLHSLWYDFCYRREKCGREPCGFHKIQKSDYCRCDFSFRSGIFEWADLYDWKHFRHPYLSCHCGNRRNCAQCDSAGK